MTLRWCEKIGCWSGKYFGFCFTPPSPHKGWKSAILMGWDATPPIQLRDMDCNNHSKDFPTCTCTCPSFLKMKCCKHLLGLQIWLRNRRRPKKSTHTLCQLCRAKPKLTGSHNPGNYRDHLKRSHAKALKAAEDVQLKLNSTDRLLSMFSRDSTNGE